jgi:hypothetical protein
MKTDKKLIFETKDNCTAFCLASQVVGFRQERDEYVIFLENGSEIRCKAKEVYYKQLSDILDKKCDPNLKISRFEELMSEAAQIILYNKKDPDLGYIICNLFGDSCSLCTMKEMCRMNHSKDIVNKWLREDY